uniref:Pentatricopeptide repeat-containing protein n=1 Tax=Kalanchoe fedtschenkoi TaxID=63787 RepID=A0A7N0V0K4_KALFE
MSIRPNVSHYVGILDALSSVKNLNKLQRFHAQMIKLRISTDEFIRAKLVSCYASCGKMDEAEYVFFVTNKKSTFLYNVMMRGYASMDLFAKSLLVFRQMLYDVKPFDLNTFPVVLKSVAGLPSLRLGKQVHSALLVNGFALDLANCNALISMYSKCGSLIGARKVFDKMSVRNSVTWTSMIGGYRMHGEFGSVFVLFLRMLDEGQKPDEFVFSEVLGACAHGGLVEQGLEWFGMMEKTFGVRPGLRHYTCVVDMLGRAGRVEEAEEMISSMDVEPDNALWRALLAACKVCGKAEIAERIEKKLNDKMVDLAVS